MNMYWQPGQTIPITPESDQAPATEDIDSSSSMMDILQGFQTSMEKQLSSINNQLGSINGRMDNLEGRQIVLEKELKATTPKCAPTASGRSRGRVTPTALQVIIVYPRVCTQ